MSIKRLPISRELSRTPGEQGIINLHGTNYRVGTVAERRHVDVYGA